MSEESDALFEAFFALEDVREVLRQTAPKHRLTPEDKAKVSEALTKVKAAVSRLERKL